MCVHARVCVVVSVCACVCTCVCVYVCVSPLPPPPLSRSLSLSVSLVRRPSWGQRAGGMSSCSEEQSGALSGEMAVHWVCGLWSTSSGLGAVLCGACTSVCVRERERERQRRSVSAEQTLQQTAKSGVSTWAPPMPSPQLFVLVQPLACALAHAQTRTHGCILLLGKVPGGQGPPSASIQKVTCLAPPRPPSLTTAGPPCSPGRCVPALSSLAGRAEMTPSLAPGGPCLLAMWALSSRQSPCPRLPRALHVPLPLSLNDSVP